VPGIAGPIPTPEIQPADRIAGTVLDSIADRLGIERGVPVAVGTYDSFVDVFGTGTTEPGSACIILGSTLIMGVVTESPCATPDMRSSLHVGSGWLFSGWTSCCGSLIDWSRRMLPSSDLPLEPGAGGLIALPYFAGERAPHWDPEARGVILGLTLETTPAQMQRAMIDAVALSARDLAERLNRVPIERWRVGGGGAYNDALLQALCDAIGRPLEIVSHAGEAIAPAMLAARAVGRRIERSIERTVEPNGKACATYDALYAVYRDLYPALAASMHKLAALRPAGSETLESSLEEV
jgi:xylulokinase